MNLKNERGYTMKPYMIVEGSNQKMDAFEKKVTDALESGYTLAGELIAQPHGSEIKFYQPLILSEDEEWEEDEDEDEEEDEDED